MFQNNSSPKSRLAGWALMWGSDRRLVWGAAAVVGFGSYLAREFAGGLTMSAVFAASSVAIIGTHTMVRLSRSRRERIRRAAERGEIEAEGVRLRAEVEDLRAQLAKVRSHLNLLDPQAGAERNLEGGPSASRAEHDS